MSQEVSVEPLHNYHTYWGHQLRCLTEIPENYEIDWGTPSLFLKCQFLRETNFSMFVDADVNHTTTLMEERSFFVHALTFFTNTLSVEREINTMMSLSETWLTLPLDERDWMVSEIASTITCLISQCISSDAYGNIYLELDVIKVVYTMINHTIDVGDEEETESDLTRVMRESLEAAQHDVILRPAPPEFLESLVTDLVCEVEGDHIQQCMVCLENLVVGAKVKRLPCDHCFHEECITRWFQEKDTCPLCRCGGPRPTS